MKHTFFVLVALVALAAFTAPAAAQDVNVTVPSGANSTDGCAEPIPVDNHTAVCSATLDGNTAELVVYSDRPQRGVTLTGPFREGHIARSQFQLREGRNTLRLELYETGGRIGVVIDTGARPRGITIRGDNSLIAGPYDGRDAQTAAIGGASSVALITIFLTIRAVTGRAEDPERIA